MRATLRNGYVGLRELRMAGAYCVLKAYMDESYGNATMCVGGWLCAEGTWTGIETKWLQRIGYEGRISSKRGHKPISRYHATDCANLKKEFSKSNGWDIPRQIEFVKRLIDILGGANPKPVGIAAGLPLKDLRARRPDWNDKKIKQAAYHLCMCECLSQIGEAMNEELPSETVAVVHDSTEFNRFALAAYDGMWASKFPYAHYFKAFTPGRWQDYPALQPADLIAFEGFKLTAQPKRTEQDLRKALQRAIGHDIDIRAAFFKTEGLDTFATAFEAGAQ